MLEKTEIEFGKDVLILETGKLAKQANGSVLVQYGGTVVLVAVVVSEKAKDGLDFLPLTVEYKEKTYAAGRIPGGFFKREGRPSEKEILTSRLIDRPIRPLFPKGCTNEIQVVITVLSSDGKNDPDILAMIGSSAALTISNIPFAGPIGAVKIGRIDDQFIINPSYEDIEQSSIELILAGTKDGVVMIEAGCKQVTEELMAEAIKFGHNELVKIIALQEEFAAKCGKQKLEISVKELPQQLFEQVKELSAVKLAEVFKNSDKNQRKEGMDAVAEQLIAELINDESEYTDKDVLAALAKIEKEQVRKIILETGKRIDGRGFEEVRQITCEVSALPCTHGSAVFTRGQTQSLSVATLGTSDDEQRIDALEGESKKRFMLHYNFPAFSVGEVRPLRGPGRREIGHGALAERALLPVMPLQENFPYTIRLVSEILESNGSSSMATVCAGTLSLMDAGVPIQSPVSGIAMGLIKDGEKYAVLTDIMGAEDHFGDMDFKVTGTSQGITAMQLDLKIGGIDFSLLEQALSQAKKARLFILGEMIKTINQPRSELSEYAPRITVVKVPLEKIKDIIGPGGKIVKKIVSETGAKINIEDDGNVSVSSVDEKAAQKALEMIGLLIAEVEVGKIYQGKITRLMNFGAFCEVLPNKEGLIHVSELADKFVKNVEDVVKVGDQVTVKVIEKDKMGRINLSIKQAIAN